MESDSLVSLSTKETDSYHAVLLHCPAYHGV